MSDAEIPTTPGLLSLQIDASHHVDELARRAQDLEHLVVKLAEYMAVLGLSTSELDDREQRLLDVAVAGVQLRERVRERDLEQGVTP